MRNPKLRRLRYCRWMTLEFISLIQYRSDFYSLRLSKNLTEMCLQMLFTVRHVDNVILKRSSPLPQSFCDLMRREALKSVIIGRKTCRILGPNIA